MSILDLVTIVLLFLTLLLVLTFVLSYATAEVLAVRLDRRRGVGVGVRTDAGVRVE